MKETKGKAEIKGELVGLVMKWTFYIVLMALIIELIMLATTGSVITFG